jgi:DNA-binding NtrC family response regulator
MEQQVEIVSSLKQYMKEKEREYVQTILDMARGNVSKAGKLAGMNRTAFYKVLARHGVKSYRLSKSGEKVIKKPNRAPKLWGNAEWQALGK